MKKSEALKILDEVLIYFWSVDHCNSEMILKELLNAGMLPPVRPDYMVFEEYIKDVNKKWSWEPEEDV